jgi:phosphate uptake regulator
VADHATNIAEDVIFWVQGADVRHNVHPSDADVQESEHPTTRASGL